MKGIILAGGNGRRLNPITDVTNKHLLPVYNKPMIFYPLQTLLDAGVTDIVVVTGKEYAGGFLRLLGSGRDFGARFTFEIQEEAGGIAQAIGITEHIVGDDSVAVILGDNIFEDNFSQQVLNFKSGAHLFLQESDEPERFGVVEMNNEKIVSIEEKPEAPKSNLVQTGMYLYDNKIFDVIKNLKPSERGEFEITDVNRKYLELGELDYSIIDGDWTDAGTFESLYKANRVARNIYLKQRESSSLKKAQS